MNNVKKKNSKQKRVLIASIILAGVITIGGTFAWFTSTDEVTNRLTATNNYGVSIVESFTPPPNWVPGQEVEKKVGVTNTGNIDAFVKVTLSNFIDITTEGIGITISEYESNPSDYDLVELSNTSNFNSTGSNTVGEEVKAIQAGGRLVYGKVYDMESFGVVPTERQTLVDSDNFAPTETGLYIFESSVSVSGSGTDDDPYVYTYKYDGYYYVVSNSNSGGEGKYYAINLSSATITRASTNEISYVTDVDLDSITLRTTHTLQNQDLTFLTDSNNSNSYIWSNTNNDNDITTYYLRASYDNSIIIDINLDDKYAGYWELNTESATETNLTFYYNYILLGGFTSENLIKSLTLEGNVYPYNIDTSNITDYISFDYNLTLKAESIQVVYNSDGSITYDESAKAVNSEWADDPAKVILITVDDTQASGATKQYKVTWNFSK